VGLKLGSKKTNVLKNKVRITVISDADLLRSLVALEL